MRSLQDVLDSAYRAFRPEGRYEFNMIRKIINDRPSASISNRVQILNDAWIVNLRNNKNSFIKNLMERIKNMFNNKKIQELEEKLSQLERKNKSIQERIEQLGSCDEIHRVLLNESCNYRINHHNSLFSYDREILQKDGYKSILLKNDYEVWIKKEEPKKEVVARRKYTKKAKRGRK